MRRQPPPRSLKQILRRARNIAIAVVIVFGMAYASLIKAEPKVVVNDTSYTRAADYTRSAREALDAWRNRSKLTLDRSGIETSMKRQFPEIDDLKIEVPFFAQTLTFKLDIAAPTFNLSNRSSLYIVGANGVVVAASAAHPSLSKLPTLIDKSGFEASPGKQVLGTESINFINAVLAQCQKAGVKVESLTLPAAPQTLELKAEGSAYFVKFDLGGDATLQTGQYLAAKHKFDSENAQPSQYLDVRVAGKIYYK